MPPKKYNIEQIQEIARKNGGKLISDNFATIDKKYSWECQKGHVWKAVAFSIIHNGSWCPKCAGNIPKTIDDAKVLAKSRNGECLSISYINCHTKLKWQCANGHIWDADYAHVNGGGWCPQCYKSIGEELSRYYIEQLTEERFPSTRTVLGNGLELDGFCPSLSLAFEYNGSQHYHWNSYFHKTKRIFEKTKSRDSYKIEKCKSLNIKLIVIPYYVLKSRQLLSFIVENLDLYDIEHIDKSLVVECEFWKSYHPVLKGCQEFAKHKGGQLISTIYIGFHVKLLWKCSCGYQWHSSWAHVKNGTWCPKCGGTLKYTIDDMEYLAEKNEGKCLSPEYINGSTELKWECRDGHIWMTKPKNIMKGHWCRRCRMVEGIEKRSKNAKLRRV